MQKLKLCRSGWLGRCAGYLVSVPAAPCASTSSTLAASRRGAPWHLIAHFMRDYLICDISIGCGMRVHHLPADVCSSPKSLKGHAERQAEHLWCQCSRLKSTTTILSGWGAALDGLMLVGGVTFAAAGRVLVEGPLAPKQNNNTNCPRRKPRQGGPRGGCEGRQRKLKGEWVRPDG